MTGNHVLGGPTEIIRQRFKHNTLTEIIKIVLFIIGCCLLLENFNFSTELIKIRGVRYSLRYLPTNNTSINQTVFACEEFACDDFQHFHHQLRLLSFVVLTSVYGTYIYTYNTSVLTYC